MEYGSMSIQQLQSGRWLNWGIRFFLTAALTASQTAGGYAPFALGCIAAAGPGADGAAALLGGVTGALLFLDFQQVLALAAVGILILTAATAFRDTAFLQKPWVLPVLAAGMVLAVGGIYVLQSLDPLSHAAPCAAASALTGVSAHFFTRLFEPEEDRLAPEGLLFLGAALTLALGDLTILNVSVGRVLLCALLAYTAYDQGPMTGVTAGLGLGLITDLSAGTSGLFTAAYGVAGLCAAKCRRRSIAALAFFSGAAVAMLTSREELAQTLLLETVAGSLLFLALPRRIFGGKRLLREAAPDTTQRTALKTHLNRAAEALRELYDSMSRTPPPQEENPAVIFDRAAEQVCRSCVLCANCWQQNYNATYNAFNDACPALLRRGTAQSEDFPLYFTARCVHLREFVAAVNEELRLFLLRRQYHRQLSCSRRQAQEQYAQMGDLLAAAAHAPAEEPTGPVGYRVSSALRPKEGQQLCGDQLATVETGGMLYLLLSDGMGSGPEAHREAALTVRLLEQFLRAGIEPAPALKTLNSALALRGETGGAFTTIDLLALRRSTGEATLYKYGAAPSYLKHTAHVTRFTAHSLPAGLQATTEPPEVTRLALPAGSYFVMISDGIADENSDEWLQNLLAGWNGTDVHALTALILSESRSRRGLEDDCAVLAVHLPLPGENRPRQV